MNSTCIIKQKPLRVKTYDTNLTRMDPFHLLLYCRYFCRYLFIIVGILGIYFIHLFIHLLVFRFITSAIHSIVFLSSHSRVYNKKYLTEKLTSHCKSIIILFTSCEIRNLFLASLYRPRYFVAQPSSLTLGKYILVSYSVSDP